MIKKILYFTTINVADGEGCSINEQGFMEALEKSSCEAFFFINKNSKKLKSNFSSPLVFFNVPKLKDIYASYQIAKEIYAAVKKNDIDFLVTRLQSPTLMELFLLYYFKLPLAIRHAGWGMLPQTNTISEKIYQKLSFFIQKLIYRKAIALDAPTPQLAHKVEILIGQTNTVKVCQNVTDINMFRPLTIKKNSKNIVFMGIAGLQPTCTGALPMLEALSIVLRKTAAVHLIIVGKDKDFSLVEKRAKALHIEKKCTFIDTCAYSDVPAEMNKFDICYSIVDQKLLSANGNSSQKVRQYIACGKPVISTKVGHEFIEENDLGSLVDPEDYEDIASKTLYWIKRIQKEGPSLQKRIRQYAVDHLSYDKSLEKRLKFWNEALNKKK